MKKKSGAPKRIRNSVRKPQPPKPAGAPIFKSPKVITGYEPFEEGFTDIDLESLHNSLGINPSLAGLGFPGSLGFPGNQGVPWSQPLSNANTGFINLRWYLVSNFRQFLNELYVEIGLVQTIVDVPVDDAFRGGIEINTQQLSEEEIKDLLVSLKRDGDLDAVKQAAKWNRLFGGSGVIIMTEQDSEEPLDLNSIGPDTKLHFRAVDMWELFWSEQNLDDSFDATIQEHEYDYYNYYGIRVHKSRVMTMKGLVAPSFIRPRLRGWGFSVVEALIRSINQYFKATDLAFEVLDEFKVDVYQIKNLANLLMSPAAQGQVRDRIARMNLIKNYQNAVVMDSEDKFDNKQLSFSGLGEMMEQIRMQVASDMRMPQTKLFGTSAAGFNSGEDDIEVYNAMVEGQVREKVEAPLIRIIEIKCQKLFGFIPDDIEIEFASLRVMKATDEENCKTQKFQRVSTAKAAGEITTKEYRESINRDNLLPVQLDTSDQIITALETASENVGATDSKSKDDNSEDDVKNGPEATQNSLPPPFVTFPKPHSTSERISRVLANSAEFDRRSYGADGGDAWIHPKRELFFDKDKAIDKGLWARAEDASMKALGEKRWQFVVWFYKKFGGKFQS